VRTGLRLEGWLTLAVGAVFTAVAVGSLVIFAAWIADPACLPQAAEFDLSGIYALLVAGVAAVVAGVLALRNPQGLPTRFP
jgi:hypothetical protein